MVASGTSQIKSLTIQYNSKPQDMKTLFTDAERQAMRDALKYSKPTHGFNDSIDFKNSNRYGTNANGTKYTK